MVKISIHAGKWFSSNNEHISSIVIKLLHRQTPDLIML